MAGRNYPLLLAFGVALLLSGLVGAAAVTGVLPMNGKAETGVVAAVAKVKPGPVNATGTAVYRVTVRMDDGSERTLTSTGAPQYPVGARVRVNGNALERG
jgi:hypothetical protein